MRARGVGVRAWTLRRRPGFQEGVIVGVWVATAVVAVCYVLLGAWA